MIEPRQLTSEATHRAVPGQVPRQMTIEAATPDDAITEFIRRSECELVSTTRPLTGRESIATIRKNESVFLLRVYAA